VTDKMERTSVTIDVVLRCGSPRFIDGEISWMAVWVNDYFFLWILHTLRSTEDLATMVTLLVN